MKVEEVLAGFFVKNRKVFGYNPEKIGWTRVKNQNELYEQYPAFQQKPLPDVDYINLLMDLKKHNGKLIYNGFIYCLKKDKQTIRRKLLF